jgi:hypothetical protein
MYTNSKCQVWIGFISLQFTTPYSIMSHLSVGAGLDAFFFAKIAL